MKKVIVGIIIVVMVISNIMSAMALPNYEQAEEAIRVYMNKNGIYDMYNGVTDENDNSVYRTSGFVDVDYFEKQLDVDGSWEEPERWFEKSYAKGIMKNFPEYGKVNVVLTRIANENDINIYKVIVTTEYDSVEWIDGLQTRIELLTAFGKV